MAQTTLSQPGDTGAPSPAPQLSPEALAALGDALLAISGELQSHDDDASRSLNDWLAWLDDEGYDQPLACEALQTLCQQQLAPEAYGALLADARAMAEQGEGLQPLIQQLEASQPLLLEQLLEIEQQRHTQLETLQAMAGGMSKQWKAGLIGGAVGVGVGVGIGVGAHYIGKWRANKVSEARAKERAGKQAVRHEEDEINLKGLFNEENAADIMARADEKERQKLEDGLQTKDWMNKKGLTNLAKDGIKLDPNDQMAMLMREADKVKGIDRMLSGDPFTINKPASRIAEKDIFFAAQNMGEAHQRKFVEHYGKEIIDNRAETLFHSSPEFREILKDQTINAIKKDPSLFPEAERTAWNSEGDYAEHLMETKFAGNMSLLDHVDNMEDFKASYAQSFKTWQSRLSNDKLRNALAGELREAYQGRLDKDLKDALAAGKGEDMVHSFEVKLDESIMDHHLIKNFSLEKRVDNYLVGKMKKGMEADKSVLEKDAVSHKEAITSELESDVKADVSQDLESAKQSAEADARKSMSEFKDEIEGEAVQMDEEARDSIRTAERDSGDLISF